MAGPWEDYAPRPASGGGGPWTDFAGTGRAVPAPKVAQGIGEAIIAGLQDSSLGLALRGRMPDQVLDENSPWYHRFAKGVGALGGDFIPGVIGAVAGAPVGGVVGAAVSGPAAPAGAAIGAGAGMMAGGMAVPMALREALIDAYTNDYALNWTGVWEIAKSALKGGGKGAVIGLATAGAGRAVAPALAAASPVVRGATTLGAEVATMTSVASALEGHIPTWQDFMDNAILLGGVKGAIGTAKVLRSVYGQTGKKPAEVVADAAMDPALKAEILKGTADDIPAPYRALALEERVKAALPPDAQADALMKLVADPTKPIDISKAPLDKPVRLEYVVDGDTYKGVLRATQAVYEAQFEKARRGEVPNKQTLAESVELAAQGMKRFKVGETANAAETLAHQTWLGAAVREFKAASDTLAKAVAEGGEGELSSNAKLAWLAAREKLVAINAESQGIAAEWGRAGQIMRRLKYDSAFRAEAEGLIRFSEKSTDFGVVAKIISELKDPNALIAAAKTPPESGLAAFIRTWRAAIFSGPLTWEANILGGVLKTTADIVEAPVKAGILAVTGKGSDPLARAQLNARAVAPLVGLHRATIEGVGWMADAIKLASQKDGKAIVAKIDAAIARGGDYLDTHDPQVRKTPIGAAAKKFEGFSFGMLKFLDLPFRTIAERAETYTMAVDRAVKEGLHPSTKEFGFRVEQIMRDPFAGLSEKQAAKALGQIENAGAEMVFGQRLGPRVERVSSAISGTPWELLMPARRTPINLLDWSMQHIPGMNFLSSRWRADFAAGGERQAQALARLTVGTSLAAIAYWMAENDMLTGGGLLDKEQARTKEGAGRQPYSVKVGDTWYSIQRMEPVAKIFQLSADLVEIAKNPKLDDATRDKALGALVMAFGNATISTTYLSGLANTLRAVTDYERYGATWVEGYASSLVPKIVGQPVAMSDEYKREVDGALEAIQSQVPFLRELLLPKRDVWGKPVANNRWFDVLPITTTTEAKEKVKIEAVRLAIGIQDAPQYMKESGMLLKDYERRLKMLPAEQDIWRQERGKLALEWLSPIVNHPDWDRMPSGVQALIYKDVLSDAAKVAHTRAIAPDAAARVKLRESIMERTRRQIDEAAAK